MGSIDWVNLSHEDKQVFFSWLDEFFVMFTGDDSFIPKDQPKRVPAPARSVPPSVKDAMASMVGEKCQGPPVSTATVTLVCEVTICHESQPPIATWSKPSAPAFVPPPQPAISGDTASMNTTRVATDTGSSFIR